MQPASGDGALHPVRQFALGHGADHLVDDFATLEHVERRDRADAVLRGDAVARDGVGGAAGAATMLAGVEGRTPFAAATSIGWVCLSFMKSLVC